MVKLVIQPEITGTIEKEINGNKIILKVAKINKGKGKGREISEYGDVIGQKRLFLKIKKRASGIMYTSFGENNKTVDENVHVLVARAFLPIHQELPYVLFLDGNIENVHYTNLKWSDTPELENDVFKTIPGYSSYKISKDARIRSYFNHIPLSMKLHLGEKGYMSIKIVPDKGDARNEYIHRLVAITYIPNPDKLPEVDHINKIRTDNRLENLRWVTKQENCENRNNKSRTKTISQYDLNRNKIREFSSSKEAVKILKLDIHHKYLNECAKKNKKDDVHTCLDYVWKYEQTSTPYVLKKGEISVPIIGEFSGKKFYFPNHKITNFGNVLNNDNFKLQPRDSNICPSITLSMKGEIKGFQIHILVATFFIKGWSSEKYLVDHLDEDRTNPHFKNLEWVTPGENNKRASHKKAKKVKQIHAETDYMIEIFSSMIEAANSIDEKNAANISGGISKCCKGLQETCMGYKWELVK